MRPVPPIPVLGGPTASGKTALALELAAEHPGLEVVSADAMMVYIGMDAGTAKPDRAERERVPHHLLDLVPPNEDYSVAAWVSGAEAAIEGILERGGVPLVVGGTGFYIRSLSEGQPTTPPSDPAVIAGLEAELAERRLEAMVAELEAASPVDAARAARNPRRVLRALEVLRTTGRPASLHPSRPPRYPFRKIVLSPDPATLDRRISRRTRAMLDGGLIEEARGLAALYARPGRLPTSLQAIGYKQALDHLQGLITLPEGAKRIDLATRQYAKRQRTWFRAEPNVTVLDTPEAARRELDAALEGWLGR